MLNFRWRIKKELIFRLGELIKPWLRKFSADDEEVWKMWIEYYRNNAGHGLTELFFTGADEKFKAKALIILLTPDFEFLPFKYRDNGITKNSFSPWYFLGHKQGLSLGNPELENLAVDLIGLFSMYYRRKPKIFHEDFQEGSLLSHYNHVIKKIIWQFHPDNPAGKRLFEMYDCFAIVEKDAASPARIFRDFSEDPVIPDIWKIKLDEKYRPLIGQPDNFANLIEGRRLEKDDYIRNFEIQVKNIRIKDFSYSPELFLSQLQAVIGFGISNINPFVVRKILEVTVCCSDKILVIAKDIVPQMGIWTEDDLHCAEEIFKFLESEFPRGTGSRLILEDLRDKIKVVKRYLIEQPAAREKKNDCAKKELEEKKKQILKKMCSS